MSDDRPESVFSTSSRHTKYLVSFVVYYTNFVLVSSLSILSSSKCYELFAVFQGTSITFLSPLVLEFTSRFNSSVDQVSKVFTIILICYLSSALLGMCNIK